MGTCILILDELIIYSYSLKSYLCNTISIDNGYVEQYQAYYDDDPLPIGRYYEKVEELEAISRLFNKPEADIEALWDKHGKRIAELERVLAA